MKGVCVRGMLSDGLLVRVQVPEYNASVIYMTVGLFTWLSGMHRQA